MSINFTGIKNITVGRMVPGTKLITSAGEMDAYGTKATMYLDGSDLNSMKEFTNGNGRLEVITLRSSQIPQISGIIVNGKPIKGALNNLPVINKLGKIFNKILKTPDSKLRPSDEFLSHDAYLDITGDPAAAKNLKEQVSPQAIETYFASAVPVKTAAKDMMDEMKTSIAFESKVLSDILKINRDIVPRPLKPELPN